MIEEVSGSPDQQNRDEVIRRVFTKHFQSGASEVLFTMDDIRAAIAEVAAQNPGYREHNVADVRYQYASGRRSLPESIDQLGPWMIEGRGKAKYAFVRLETSPAIAVQSDLETVLLPDATPEIVKQYAGADEQGILALIHYNRLLDIFLRLACYHIQNHWRTVIAKRGQCEVDDMYVAVNHAGQQFAVPVEAKCSADQLSKTQIAQMVHLARERYPSLILRPVGVQQMRDQSLVLIEFTPAEHPDGIKIKDQRRYKLVPMAEVPLLKQQGADLQPPRSLPSEC